MLRRPQLEDELHLLEEFRKRSGSVVLALDLAFTIVDAVDVAAKIREGGGSPLTDTQKREWRYRIVNEFIKHIASLEEQWITEGAKGSWWWRSSSRSLLFKKWRQYLSKTGPRGVRRSLKRIAQEFVDEWIRGKI